MESYWPTAGQKSGASKHDIEHSRWANNAHKIVFSKTITETHWDNTRIIASNAKAEMARLKSQAGKNLLILGSPGLVESFMREDLIDEFHLTVNPVVLGNGKRLFAQNANTVDLQLLGAKRLTSGVVALSYEKS
ncbi:MAG TPA: dihydrofolate reductase family protein [Candidatus Saccharimonadia bacterium]|nr:dihydrofolate reductase family protein [Candidatus Saccharimonadia bacterium]